MPARELQGGFKMPTDRKDPLAYKYMRGTPHNIAQQISFESKLQAMASYFGRNWWQWPTF